MALLFNYCWECFREIYRLFDDMDSDPDRSRFARAPYVLEGDWESRYEIPPAVCVTDEPAKLNDDFDIFDG